MLVIGGAVAVSMGRFYTQRMSQRGCIGSKLSWTKHMEAGAWFGHVGKSTCRSGELGTIHGFGGGCGEHMWLIP